MLVLPLRARGTSLLLCPPPLTEWGLPVLSNLHAPELCAASVLVTRDHQKGVWCGPRAKSADDARDTLKMLRSQGIGEAAALLYTEWAQLECAAGEAC